MAPTCCSTSAVGSTFSAAIQFFAASQCLVQEPWPPHAITDNGATFDFIVVGGGTAGSLMAARLADSFSVLLIEAGPDPPQESIVPALHSSLISSVYDWNFTTVSDGVSGRSLPRGQLQPRGRMLGGSGSINNMIYSRGFPADYEDWAATAGQHWTWDNVLPYFKKTEHMTDENIQHDAKLMSYHGRNGEIEVSGKRESSEEIRRFLDAFKEIGFNIVSDMTNPETIGAGMFSHTVRDGKRDSTLTALLNKAKMSNLSVLKNTLVSKILFENDRAIGVKVLQNEVEELEFYAKNEVVISAGTFNTPKLLLLSGIGPRHHLDSLDIDVVKDLPGVGGNLHDHVMYLNYIAVENGTCYQSEASSSMEVIKYLYNRSGALANADSMGALLALNGSDPKVPDFAFYPVCTQFGTRFYEGCLAVVGFDPEICAQLDAQNHLKDLLSFAVVLLNPKSRGRVRLRSKNPLDDPLIYSGTFHDAEDLEGFPEAVKIVHKIAQTEYFKRKSAHVVDLRIPGCEGLTGVEEVKCKARAMSTSAWHAVGTAAMGRVVDAELKVLGIKGLRVVDASVMPKLPRGNTNAPVVMIAEKAAQFVRKAYGAE